MNDIVLAHALREVALLSYHEQSRIALREIGEAIVKNAATTLYDEYRATPFSTPKMAVKAA